MQILTIFLMNFQGDVREGFCLVPEVSIYRWRIKFPKDLWNQLRSCLIPQVGGPFFQVL